MHQVPIEALQATHKLQNESVDSNQSYTQHARRLQASAFLNATRPKVITHKYQSPCKDAFISFMTFLFKLVLEN